MISSLALQFIALVVGVGVLLLVWYKPGWGALAAISAASLLDCFGIGTSMNAGTSSSGVNVYPDDVACVMLVITGVLLILRYPKCLSRDLAPCIFLMALIVFSFGRGLATYDLKQAGNSARNLFTFVAPAITIMLLRPVFRLDAARLARWFAWAGGGLCLIALLRWAGILSIPEEYIILDQKELREVVRALPSDYAIVIGQAFIGAIYFLIVGRRKSWCWWVCAGMFGAITLALQHRSVWTATIAGLIWLAIRTGRLSPMRWLSLGAAALVAVGLVMIADPAILQSAGELLSSGVSETQSKHSTWAWRVDGYVEATDRVLESGPIDMLLGPPAGWSANSGGSFASIHIHSRYVDTLAYYGFVGSFGLLVWFGMVMYRCRRGANRSARSAAPRSSRALLQALLISELVYLVPYFGGLLQGCVFGLVWVAATQGMFQSLGRRVTPVFVRAACSPKPMVLAIQK